MNHKARRLESQILGSMKNPTAADSRLVKKSLSFCIQYHGDQKRISGEPYWTHPANVALILAGLDADAPTISAAILHDTLEDTQATEAILRKEFSPEITELVKGVTKLDRLSQQGRERSFEAANLQKILLASAKDLRVMAIKLADKCHNMRTLYFLPKKDQARISSQCLTVFVPLAHKMGMHDLMHELEDLSLSFVNPKKFKEIKAKLRKQQAEKEREGKELVRILQQKMKNIRPRLGLYKKTVFSTLVKINRTGKSLQELYDSVILTIETNDIDQCYQALGILHRAFFPLPNKLKDYIAIPLPNSYQALHTSVIGPQGKPFKVYIATGRMFQTHRKGILSFASATSDGEKELFRERIKKINALFNMPYRYEETEEFMRTLMQESLSKTIFVFTPKGDMIELPFGATPIDFAFKLNPNLGKRIWRAKVDGKFMAFDTMLQSGNIVEIVASRNVQIRHQWLEMASAISTKQAITKLLEKRVEQKHRPVDIVVIADDRVGLMSDATKILQSKNINIDAGLALSQPNGTALLQFNIPPCDEETLHELIAQLQAIQGVKTVTVERP